MTEDGSKRLEPPRSRRVRVLVHLLSSVAVAALFGYYVLRDYGTVTGLLGGPGSGRPLDEHWLSQLCKPGLLSVFFILVRNSLLTFFFLSRKMSRETSTGLLPWLSAIGGTFIGYHFLPKNAGQTILGSIGIPTALSEDLGIGVMLAGLLLSIVAVSSLGRSFGLVPSNRGIRTGGLYRLVRHPAYGSYFICDFGFVLVNPTIRNFLVFVAFVQLSYYRSVYEEQLLIGDPDYRAYHRAVPWRFIPGIW